MDEVVARCPDCGMEQAEAFAHCFVCMKSSRWWCLACRTWLPTRACPVCRGGIGVPVELFLGLSTIGSTIAFKVTARNSGKKLVGCEVTSPDPGVAITNPRILVPAGGSIDVRGGITLPPGPLGRRAFRLSFNAPVSAETLLAVEVMVAAPRLDFFPSLVVLRSPKPGSTVRTSVALKNTGNVPLSAKLSTSASWMKAEPKKLTLAPGESAEVKVRTGSKKTDSGTLEAQLIAAATSGPYSATVRYILPDPEVKAEPVAFGEVKPGRAVFAELVLRNTGRVRVICAIAPAHSWLRALPARVNLPVGREKIVRVRAFLTTEHDGPQCSELLVVGPGGPLLQVPVTATGKVPKGILRAVRKQRLLNAIGPPVERKFQVANDGDGRLDVVATTDKPWVKILTPDLRVAPGKKRKLRYALDLPTLPRGEHSATITLTSNGGNIVVPVTVHVLDPNPVLEVVPMPHLGLITPNIPLSAFVQVRNAGIGLLTVKAESENPGIRITPDQIDVSAGPPVRFNLLIPVEGLPDGEQEVGIRLTSNGGSDRAVMRFRLPVERIDVSPMIDLGDRPVGRITGDALRVQNVGPDRVNLRLSSAHQWLRLDTEQITVNPGETLVVPFRMELLAGELGLVTSSIRVEGRSVCQMVAVQVMARKVELIVVLGAVMLGDMIKGEERAFVVDVVNAGEMVAEIHPMHILGELELWVRRATVRPGERASLTGRVRMNSKQLHREVRVSIPLVDDSAHREATLRLIARVVPPMMPKLLSVAAATGAVIVCGSLLVANGWWGGIPLALVGVVAGFLAGLWFFWREKG